MKDKTITRSKDSLAILWMLAASLLVTAMGALVKYLGETVPVVQMAAVRSGFLLIAIFPFMLRQRRDVFRPGNKLLLLARSGTLIIVNVLGFWVLTQLPLAYVTAISFSKPLFIALLAVLFLGETLRLRRSCATIVGFAGVIIMLNPTAIQPFGGDLLAACTALFVAFTMALGVILVKRLAASDHPNTIIFYGNLSIILVLAVPAAIYWHDPGPVGWLLLVAMGLVGLAAQSCFIRAYQTSDASFVAPFEYSRILYAVLVGYVVFAEVPNLWTAFGALLIIASTLYMARREAQLGRKASMGGDKATPPQASTGSEA